MIGGVSMERKVYELKDGPKAVGPYSIAAGYGDLLFVSGQIPIVPETGEIKSDASIKEQAHQCLENLKTVLEGCGSSLERVIKCRIYITDMRQFGVLNEVYSGYFKVDPPARAVVEVAGLPKGVDVEIEAVAGRG